MNKEFARKFVEWQAKKLTDHQKNFVTFGDLMDVSNRVANDELDLDMVFAELNMAAFAAESWADL